MDYGGESVPLSHILGGKADPFLRQPLSLRMKLALLHLTERNEKSDRGADAAYKRTMADRVALLNVSRSSNVI